MVVKMIDDSELRDLFKIESVEHIQHLEEAFLRLEKRPGDRALLEESFREAHSLKGAAHILGLTHIERISHRLEDILGAANKGAIPLSSEVLDRLYQGVDALRKLVNEAVTGAPSLINIPEVIGKLKMDSKSPLQDPGGDKGFAETGVPESEIAESSIPPRQRSSEERETSAAPPETPGSEIDAFRIDTIRVETTKLDALMTQAGELSVAGARIAKRLEDIGRAITKWEDLAGKISDFGIRLGSLGNEFHEGGSIYETLSTNGDSVFEQIRAANGELGALLAGFKNALDEDNSRLGLITGEVGDSIGSIRLLPFTAIFNLFPRMVRDIAKEQSKEVRLIIEGGETSADKRILEEMKDPLMHMVRNAVDHGIELPEERLRQRKPRKGSITLRAYRSPSHVVIEVSDDGKGLDLESIRRTALKRKLYSEEALSAMPPDQIHSLIFVSGFSTSSFVSDISGRGVGLDVVRANVERLKGTMHVESQPSRGLTLKILLPLTVATARVVIVTVNRVKYAIPIEYIRAIRRIRADEVFALEGWKSIVFDKRPLSVARLSDILTTRYPISPILDPQRELLSCVILSAGDETIGIFVDDVLDEQEIVLKPQSHILKRVRNISGSTILGTGETCMILNPHDLIKSARKNRPSVSEEEPEEAAAAPKRLLVAEDSITVRTQIKRILEGAGYEVTLAVDGLDAFDKLGEGRYDALVSDIMMPNMTGLALTEKIRRDKKYGEMPVILLTSLASDDDRKRGIDAGASAYITKSSFDQRVLLETLRRLI